MHSHHQKLIYSLQAEFSERAKHSREWWGDVRRSNEETKEEWRENSTITKEQREMGEAGALEWSALFPQELQWQSRSWLARDF